MSPADDPPDTDPASRPEFLTVGRMLLLVGSLALLGLVVLWAYRVRTPRPCHDLGPLHPGLVIAVADEFGGVASFAPPELPFPARLGARDGARGHLSVTFCLDPADRDRLVRWFLAYVEAQRLPPPERASTLDGALELTTPGANDGERGAGLRWNPVHGARLVLRD